MIKILFSDLDGTLLFSENKMTSYVSEDNINAINRFKKDRIFAIATSRSYSFLSKLMDINKPFDTVAYNGNLVFCDNHIIDKVSFSEDELYELINILEAENKNNLISFYNEKNDLIFYDFSYPKAQGFIKNERNYIQDSHLILKDPILEYIKNYLDICVILCVYENKEKADVVRDKVRKMKSIQIVDTSERTFSITKNNRDKITGIQKIADYYGIKQNEIAVIGDSVNDLTMFNHYYNFSFCMSHAKNEIKRSAKSVVTSVSDCINKILNED